MSGRRSRDKGNRTERAIVRLLQAQGIAATKISGMYKPGADIGDVMPIIDGAPETVGTARRALAGRDRQGGCGMTQQIAAQRSGRRRPHRRLGARNE
jgi:hypothetical protein